MSYYAYSDFERKNVVFADENPIHNNNNSFYCENPRCRAKLTFKKPRYFPKKKTFYFSASQNSPHVEGCYSTAINRSFKLSKYDETLFDFNDSINNLDDYWKILCILPITIRHIYNFISIVYVYKINFPRSAW